MKRRAFWWDIEESLRPAHTHTVLPRETEFLIVGAGYTGLSAALSLARQGKQVVVLDAGLPGFGASTRNGGICSGQIRLSHGALSDTHGQAFADEAYAEGITARLDLKTFCDEEGIDCQFQMTGRFTGAVTPKDYEAQAREVERLNRVPGHEAYMVPRAEQHREIQTDLFHGGMVRGEIGGFHPGKFFAGLLRVVEASGAKLFSQVIVQDFQPTGTSAKIVQTSLGDIKAHTIIVATNAYTGHKYKFGQYLRQRLVPVQSQIIVTEKLGESRVRDLMPHLRMYGNTANLYSYFRPTPDRDRILLGSRSFDRMTPSDRSVLYLKRRLVEIFPDLADCKIDYSWLGNVGFTRAQLPVIFQKEGIYYAAGYAGSGTVWARWMGKKVAEIALGTGNRPSVFYSKAPPKVPLYDGKPWFLPVVHRYFAAKDRWKQR